MGGGGATIHRGGLFCLWLASLAARRRQEAARDERGEHGCAGAMAHGSGLYQNGAASTSTPATGRQLEG